MANKNFNADTDVHILEEDQQKINKFARLNARFEELKDELKSMQNDLKNIEDASDDIMLLDEAAGPIPFMIGEAFIHCSQDEAQTIRLTLLDDVCE
ncbi:hypothetical protein QYM36_002917 [Artemia franciscana]|uniref:Prefoldin subunit 4 n=1 Tax=Artemia franciscana TaxID=6661 RepID=A0AA88I9P1_ARTSF|nr:hypothetical protein QYM36_002917 [Artemia franciscana]